MMNARNDLGMGRSGGIIAVLTGIALAIALVAVLAGAALAQEANTEFELRGAVVDDDSGAALVGAWVTITGSEWGSITDDQGRFRIPDLTAGPISLTVEQLGYAALTWDGPVSDATGALELRVSPEPVLLEGLQVVTDRFRARRNGVATSVRAYDQGDLTTTSERTALDFVMTRNGLSTVRCAGRAGDYCVRFRGRLVEPVVYIDEAPVVGGIDYLDSFAPYELYMVEVYGSGRHIRAYTPMFMERAAKQRLSPIPLFF